MALFGLPTAIQNIILDKYVNISSYWKNKFSITIIPEINAIQRHKQQYEKVLFEFMAYWGKRELEKYSVKGMLFSYNKTPIKQSIDSKDLWYILFEGVKIKNKRITLLFEKHFNFRNEYIIIEASGVFPMVYYDSDFGFEEDLGREMLENIQQFINNFMNSIFRV